MSVVILPHFHSCVHQFFVLRALPARFLSLSINAIVLPDSIIAHFIRQFMASSPALLLDFQVSPSSTPPLTTSISIIPTIRFVATILLTRISPLPF